MTSFLRRLFGHPADPAPTAPRPVESPPGEAGEPVPLLKRALVVIHDPVVDPQGRTLSRAMGWHDPDELAAEYVRDVAQSSHGLLRYEIAERIAVDAFPPKADGFRYSVEGFLRCWREGRGFHEPDGADYGALLREFGVLERVNAGEVDELWLFGPPYAGYWESHMVGPRAFWCNSPPLEDPGRAAGPACQRRFVVMGFNYEREVGCMLENLGHRAESIMERVYEGRQGEANLWHRFTRYDQVAPGRAAVGNMHFAPNSTRDYDWGNPRPVQSECDSWLAFPQLSGERRTVSTRDWGGGDMRLHHMWWFGRLPHAAGETGGVANNWWTYVGDPNTV